MAASDKPFRDQRTLDIVFAVSNILMLLSTGWMLAQDYYREYKTEQRVFRDVEVAMAQRQALNAIPSEEDFAKAEKKVEVAKDFRDKNLDALASARSALIGLKPAQERTEAAYQGVKADIDSFTSLLNIAVEHGDDRTRDKYLALLKDRNEKLVKAQADRDEVVNKMKLEQLKIEEIDGKYNKAVAEFKKVNDKFDTQVKLAHAKTWAFSDRVRTWFLIDGYASPLKIHQFTIDDIPIDYNFKKVTRFDRCMSCHVGIDRPAYTRANLEALTNQQSYDEKIKDAVRFYERRIKALDANDAAAIPDPSALNPVALSDKVLTASRITEFCAHPRLETFVGSNSKHPAEKFGCTSCHAGQGSGTSFGDASHSPNSSAGRKNWAKERDWEYNHMWDFPMQPMRFIESSCLKCHHEVTDLISSNNRVEAPKLLRGYGLIKENGCFGCHEISGWKGPQRVGPDLRLEPSPPLSDLTATERVRAENDPDNRPGNMRKIGPSLARVHEKVQPEWIEKWLRSPTSFRPDTKMPHYYGLSNNSEEFLKANAPEQEKFPNTEIVSITHFLTETSKQYLRDAEQQRQSDSTKERASETDQATLQNLLNKGRLDEADQKELTAVRRRIKLRKEVPLVDLALKYEGKAENGRILFTERGCLACHAHQGTEKPEASAPEISSAAVFGPNLSQVAGKLGGNTEKSRKWLVQWILNPHVHSPRSRMPNTNFEPQHPAQDAADIAAWLLSQDAAPYVGAGWADLKVEPPKREDLEKLARVYLTRMLSEDDMTRFFKKELKGDALTLVKNDITRDESDLYDNLSDDGLKFYLGKKAVNRLGCFGCHDIPGFENAKSIGVALNDWGKKAPDRLAFEDIKNFFNTHYHAVDALVDDKGNPHGMKDGKEPYEEFYREALIGHFPDRIGYLNQKIRDPRSYDFNRIRAWDDRSRMPKFTLARPRTKQLESPQEFKARIFKEEAEAREAVATFVLGLVAEAVPAKSINQPTGDRKAEVLGRQVLDKYNCNGCHLIRAGTYDFKLSPESLEALTKKHASVHEDMEKDGELIPLNHSHWTGRNPLGADRLTLTGTRPFIFDGGDSFFLRLSEAFRFAGQDKAIRSIPAGVNVEIPFADIPAYPKPIKTRADFDRHYRDSSSYGGAFADLMVGWLNKKDGARYPLDPTQDSSEARAALPPSLIAQGERTQPKWLREFLLNPTRVRKMTILRMPRFNMSEDEARILSEYFAAVSRQNNPGIGLPRADDVIPQLEDFNGDFWKAKTKKYVDHLKKPVEKGKKTLFEERVAAYKPLWQQVKEKYTPELTAAIEQLDKDLASIDESKKKTALAEAAEKDPAKKKTLKDELVALDVSRAAKVERKKQTNADLDKLDVKRQQEIWQDQEAYATDGYRLLMGPKLCTKCHQIGNAIAGEQVKQGPPLDLASKRLRPEWIERWVNQPTRFVPYASIMPPYFNRNKAEYQHLHAGMAEEQIRAVRDVLLNLERISRLPVNRLHDPDKK